MARVTIKDVASASGVSVGTVSKALNNTDSVSPATRKRVLRTAARLGYRPNQYARNLRKSDTRSVAVVVRGPLNPFFLSVLYPLEERLRAIGLQASLLRLDADDDEVAQANEYIRAFDTKAVIFLGGATERFADQKYSIIPLPLVTCTVSFEDDADAEHLNAVAVDEYAEMEKIVAHLKSLGHEKLALLGWRDNDDSVSWVRKQAFTAALERHGLELDPSLLMHNAHGLSPFSYRFGYLQCRELLSVERDFTAIVALSDTVAVGAQRALLENGMQLGQDIALTGFDGIEASLYPTTLTTIVQPVDMLVNRCIELLIDQFEGGPAATPSGMVHVPGRLRLGDSTVPGV